MGVALLGVCTEALSYVRREGVGFALGLKETNVLPREWREASCCMKERGSIVGGDYASPSV